jgi:hypothetical protein
VIRREFAVSVMPVRRAHSHSSEVGGTGSLDLVENVHV